MKSIVITSPTFGTHIVTVDDEDFWLLENYRWHLWSTPRHNGIYVMTWQSIHKSKRLHRIIMNAPDGLVVDHADGNPLNNCRHNLRLTTQAMNNKNATKRRDAKTSKYKGVSFSRPTGKWVAQIQVNQKRTGLGYYKTEIEAARVYDEAAKRLYGVFAKVNGV
jgi:hypothetical protein